MLPCSPALGGSAVSTSASIRMGARARGDYLVVLKTVRPRILPQPSGAGRTFALRRPTLFGGLAFLCLAGLSGSLRISATGCG